MQGLPELQQVTQAWMDQDFLPCLLSRFEELEDAYLAAHVRDILQCLQEDNVGLVIGDEHLLWTLGLMSGWRHTMLLNILFNICEGRAVSQWIEKNLEIVRYLAEEVGVMGGIIAQAILDTLGPAVSPATQLFAMEARESFELKRST